MLEILLKKKIIRIKFFFGIQIQQYVLLKVFDIIIKLVNNLR